MPGRPRSAPQRQGATTPSEKFSARLSMAARATPASSSARVSRPTILATASRPASTPPLVERIGHGGDMLIEAPLRDQRAREAGKDEKRERTGGSCNATYCRRSAGSTARRAAGASAIQPLTAPSPRAGSVVEAALQAIEQRAHPHDRMLDAAEQRRRIAERRLDQSARRGR